MKNLNNQTYPPEYFRVMEHRIRYYKEKYDPHTIMADLHQVESQKPTVSNSKSMREIARSCIDFFSFF